MALILSAFLFFFSKILPSNVSPWLNNVQTPMLKKMIQGPIFFFDETIQGHTSFSCSNPLHTTRCPVQQALSNNVPLRPLGPNSCMLYLIDV